MKASHAFAAHREVVVADLLDKLMVEFVPGYNAEIEDIRRRFQATVEEAAETASEIAKNALIRTAERNRDARLLDLQYRRQKYIRELQVLLNVDMKERISIYGGTLVEEERRNPKGKRYIHSEAHFTDGSKAWVPNRLVVNWDLFDTL